MGCLSIEPLYGYEWISGEDNSILSITDSVLFIESECECECVSRSESLKGQLIAYK